MTANRTCASIRPTPPPFILTKVRTQDQKSCHSWLWVLTFVRMTKAGVTVWRTASATVTVGPRLAPGRTA